MIKQQMYYVMRDKVKDDWVCTCRGIVFTAGDAEVVKRSHSAECGIFNNMQYHIQNKLNFDIRVYFDHWCHHNSIGHYNTRDFSNTGHRNYKIIDYGRTDLFKLFVETLRKPSSLMGSNSEKWKFPTPAAFLAQLSKDVNLTELLNLSKEAYKNNWSDISRYEIIPVTIKEGDV